MATDRRRQVKRLFQAALERGPLKRADFLQGAFALDPSIREEVESLIASHEEELKALSLDTTSVTLDRDDENKPGEAQHIGPYIILSEMGRGGMGVVYEAEQKKPVHRRVALKLIKSGMDTKAVIARFESERQALALMNHPNIASVYDAGATEQGRPYFAMELVHGEPITEYCDKNRLTIKDRLDLFIQVCEGVQHAHQKGIIHRDIKPSNILITIQNDKPAPKVIDFGVAKATSQRLTERTVYTELGQLIGTPEYMSPEQAEMTGIDIDTRTDVYSLGVVLYELLVGAQPFDAKTLRQASFDDMRRKIREEEPPKPSTRLSRLGEPSTTAAKNRRVDPRSLDMELRGDLDWITMKALEKDRTRRYGSPSDLAEDIRRHQRYEPVAASPPSQVYRMRKFVRRHKFGVGAAAGFVVLLAGFALMMAMQSARVARERDRAEREAAKAEAINEFLQETLGTADPYEGAGREVTVIEALDAAVDKIDKSFAGQPEIAAAVRNTIGHTYSMLGHHESAEPLLRLALEIRRETLGNEHLDVAETLYSLGLLYLDTTSEWEAAEACFRESLAIRRKLLGDEHLDVAEVLNALGDARFYQADLDGAESLFREVLAIRRQIMGEGSIDVAQSLGNLAVTLNRKGDLEAAEGLYLESMKIERDLLGDAHPQVARGLHNFAAFLSDKGDHESAVRYMREALAIDRKVFGDENPNVAQHFLDLAYFLNRKGEHETAEGIAGESLVMSRKLFGQKHFRVAAALHVLADTLVGLDRYPEAERRYREAIEIYEESQNSESYLASCRSDYGHLMTMAGRYQEAEQLLLDSLQALRDQLSEGHRRTQRAVQNVIELYEAWGKPEKAAEYRAMLEKDE